MRKSSNILKLLVFLTVTLFVLVFIATQWLAMQAGEYQSTIWGWAPNFSKRHIVKFWEWSDSPIQAVRHTYRDPGRRFMLNVYLKADEEIARTKTTINDQLIDKEGNIPDGRIAFINHAEETYGEEFYWLGKRHGMLKEYYDNGQKRREARFFDNKKITETIYYYDGTVRMKVDLSDALIFLNQDEVGTGQVYYRDGTIMYEWKLTNRLRGGYKKSYNVAGELMETKYYNLIGEEVDQPPSGLTNI